MEKGSVESVEKEIYDVIERELSNIQDFCMELAYGKITVY